MGRKLLDESMEKINKFPKRFEVTADLATVNKSVRHTHTLLISSHNRMRSLKVVQMEEESDGDQLTKTR